MTASIAQPRERSTRVAPKLPELRRRLRAAANAETARNLQWFFKTGPGEYGQGDVFCGIKVPPLRKLAAEFQDLPWKAIEILLTSQIHEERSLALMILVRQFARGHAATQERLYRFYLAHTRFINNWDLVDGSAPYIVGPFLWGRDRKQLYVLAKSPLVWERRIAILATFYFIRRNDFSDALEISRLLVGDEHPLIHKAVGWMLREMSKRDPAVVESFLRRHHRRMPRTMLRYAIERFPPAKRRRYLGKR
jgi:3-methyladenine DNA glycosylase AlkD